MFLFGDRFQTLWITSSGSILLNLHLHRCRTKIVKTKSAYLQICLIKCQYSTSQPSPIDDSVFFPKIEFASICVFEIVYLDFYFRRPNLASITQSSLMSWDRNHIFVLREIINMLENIGPKMEPCGTLRVTVGYEDQPHQRTSIYAFSS